MQTPTSNTYQKQASSQVGWKNETRDISAGNAKRERIMSRRGREYDSRYVDNTHRIPKLEDETLIVSRPGGNDNTQVIDKPPTPKQKKQRIHKVELIHPIQTGMYIALGFMLFWFVFIVITWLLWGVIHLAVNGWIIGS